MPERKEINITLNWLKPDTDSLDGLDAFFEKNGTKKGIYFWIHRGKPEHITYIGQTAEGFQKRFQTHISQFLHGKYRAVVVPANDTDYNNCLKRYYYLKKYYKENGDGKNFESFNKRMMQCLLRPH